jgi:pimeloyl-ACP methyl ester carboxylesterase
MIAIAAVEQQLGMNRPVRDKLVGEDRAGAIRRRHVLYVEGYDPRGASGFFDLFRRSCERFSRLWAPALKLQPCEIDSEDLAHWHIDMRGPSWQVDTRYDFLRLEKFIQSDMAKPPLLQALYGLGWFADDLLSTTGLRILWASWQFGLHLLYFQLLVLAWLAIPTAIAVAVAGAVATYFGWGAAGIIVALAVALALAVAAFLALSPLAERSGVIQITSCWATLRRFGRGRPTWIDHAIDVGARRVLAVAKANEADELAVIGHSTGGVIASAIVARALELDPNLGRSGPRLVLLTLGSVMPAVALHPAAQRMRHIVANLATAQALTWIDCQSRKDVMCFSFFDPVDGIGVSVGAKRCNPLLWRISFKDMFSPEVYGRFKWNFFRVHYQYIMAGDRPAQYDYVLLVGGPMAIAEWTTRAEEFTAALIKTEQPAANVAAATN